MAYLSFKYLERFNKKEVNIDISGSRVKIRGIVEDLETSQHKDYVNVTALLVRILEYTPEDNFYKDRQSDTFYIPIHSIQAIKVK